MPPKAAKRRSNSTDDIAEAGWEWKKVCIDVEPSALVGHRVKIWWDGSQCLFEGLVLAFNKESWTHHVWYDDGEESNELLMLERVMVHRRSWPGPSSDQLVSLGAFLTSKAEEAEQTKQGRSGRSRNVEGAQRSKQLLQCAQLVMQRADLLEEKERQQQQQQQQQPPEPQQEQRPQQGKDLQQEAQEEHKQRDHQEQEQEQHDPQKQTQQQQEDRPTSHGGTGGPARQQKPAAKPKLGKRQPKGSVDASARASGDVQAAGALDNHRSMGSPATASGQGLYAGAEQRAQGQEDGQGEEVQQGDAEAGMNQAAHAMAGPSSKRAKARGGEAAPPPLVAAGASEAEETAEAAGATGLVGPADAAGTAGALDGLAAEPAASTGAAAGKRGRGKRASLGPVDALPGKGQDVEGVVQPRAKRQRAQGNDGTKTKQQDQNQDLPQDHTHAKPPLPPQPPQPPLSKVRIKIKVAANMQQPKGEAPAAPLVAPDSGPDATPLEAQLGSGSVPEEHAPCEQPTPSMPSEQQEPLAQQVQPHACEEAQPVHSPAREEQQQAVAVEENPQRQQQQQPLQVCGNTAASQPLHPLNDAQGPNDSQLDGALPSACTPPGHPAGGTFMSLLTLDLPPGPGPAATGTGGLAGAAGLHGCAGPGSGPWSAPSPPGIGLPEPGGLLWGSASTFPPPMPAPAPPSSMVLSSSRLMEILLRCTKPMASQGAAAALAAAGAGAQQSTASGTGQGQQQQANGPGVLPSLHPATAGSQRASQTMAAAAEPAAQAPAARPPQPQPQPAAPAQQPQPQPQAAGQQAVVDVYQDSPELLDWVTGVPDTNTVAKFTAWAQRLSGVISDVPLPNIPAGTAIVPIKEALEIIRDLAKHSVTLGLLEGTQICKAVAMLRSHRNLHIAQQATQLSAAWRATAVAALQRANTGLVSGTKRGTKRTSRADAI